MRVAFSIGLTRAEHRQNIAGEFIMARSNLIRLRGKASLALLATGSLLMAGAAWADSTSVSFQPVSQCFRDAGASGWVYGGAASPGTSYTGQNSSLTAATGIDAAGQGWLRLTNNQNNQKGSAYYNLPINVSSLGIQVEFTYTAWGGTGADGISMYLFDGATTKFVQGDFGGALGYCAGYGNSPGGLSNAVIGVGIDDYGNFENGYDRCQNYGEPQGHSTGYYTALGMRGPGNGNAGYKWLADVNQKNVPGSIGPFTTFYTPAATTRPTDTQFYRRVRLNISPTDPNNPQNGYTVTLYWATTPNGAFTQMMSAPYPQGNTPPQAGNGASQFTIPSSWTPLPPTVKFGFAGSTGGATNYHEVRDVYFTEGLPDLSVSQIGPASVAAGSNVTYVVTVANIGSIPANNTTFSDVLPSALTNVRWSCTASAGSSCPAPASSGTISGNSFSVSGINLALVGNATFTIQGQVPVGTSSSLTNSASVAGPSGFNDAYSNNNNSTLATFIDTNPSTANLNLSQVPQTLNSIGVNAVKGAVVQTSTQIYLGQYHPANWWGQLLAYPLGANTSGQLAAGATPNWDASCVLTGPPCPTAASSTPTGAQTSRTMLTWNGSQGVAFAYTSLSSAQQTALNNDPVLSGTTSTGADVVNYLRGTRSKEQSAGGPFRTRTGILGDIVDSSPVWVGPPSLSYPTSWGDAMYAGLTPAENAAGDTYGSYKTNNATRQHVVYAGSNDGFVHGFGAGNFTSTGAFNTTTNKGQELLAYMPSTALSQIASNPSGIPISSNFNFTDPGYTHRYFVDATPGTGDLYYNGTWHTWLVGGLGGGGQGLYALDITNPANFTQGNASSLVVKEINLGNITCANNSNCKNDLGYTYGTPMIRRMHSGDWAVIFGNGYNSSTGTAAIFIATVKNGGAGTNAVGQTWSIYELDTGAGPASDPTGQHRANGINYVSSADMDGDHIADYLYAGDLYGNLWRFDVTSCNPPGVASTGCTGAWAVSKFGGTAPTALFSAVNATGTPQPITTQVQVLSVPSRVGQPRIEVMFGTGKNIETADQLPNNSPTGVQSIYGIWDWDMTSWNAISQAQYASLTGAQSIGRSVMQQQTVLGAYNAGGQAFAGAGTGYRTLSANPVCWKNTSSCPSGNNQYGFYLDLPGAGESIIYNPTLAFGTFVVNSTIPSPNSQGLSCYAPSPPGGWTMAINPLNGGALPNSFFADTTGNFVTIGGQNVSGVYLNAVGSPSFVTFGSKPYMINQDNSGNPNVQQVNPAPNGAGQRLTWTELR